LLGVLYTVHLSFGYNAVVQSGTKAGSWIRSESENLTVFWQMSCTSQEELQTHTYEAQSGKTGTQVLCLPTLTISWWGLEKGG
jgi:hypothetical protein